MIKRKLKLAKETLRALSAAELAKAGGGVPCSMMFSTCSSEWQPDGGSCSQWASQVWCETTVDSECGCEYTGLPW